MIERIGGVHLQKLTTAHLNRLYGELLVTAVATAPWVVVDVGPSPPRMLRNALNDAVRWGLLERNVALIADATDAGRPRGTAPQHAHVDRDGAAHVLGEH